MIPSTPTRWTWTVKWTTWGSPSSTITSSIELFQSQSFTFFQLLKLKTWLHLWFLVQNLELHLVASCLMMKKFIFVPLNLAFAWLQLHHDSNATRRQKNKHFSALTNEKKYFLWKSCTLSCVAECLVWVNALTAFFSTRISWLQAGLTLKSPDVQSSELLGLFLMRGVIWTRIEGRRSL